ncbi:MAG: pyridoxal phosphate-dependent aminotransferase [Deltaproteobacteria bacterium]|nr:MAG: pyridoxal phosphate-dependent aminotransferase [Deltaproteobacteria bacterium]
MSTNITDKALNIPPFIVMDVLEHARKLEKDGISVIHMEVGEPDFNTPGCIIQAGCKALKEGKTHYTHSQGILALREAICEDYGKRYGVNVNPEQVIVTSGTSPALLMLFAAMLDKDDEIIMTNPYYPCYANMVRFLGGIPKLIPVSPEENFHLTPEKIRPFLSRKVKAILVNSPSNPTGMCMDPEIMKGISDLGISIISDEIYHGIRYEGRDRSFLEFNPESFVINGFSKRYAMTGWRLGYLIAPEQWIRPLQKIQQNFFISAADFVQWAGLAALKEAEKDVARMVQTYKERRDFLYTALTNLGFGILTPPQGAFYFFADCRKFSDNAYEFAFDILNNAHVGITPGIDFGPMGEGYVRFSYANSLENIKEGIKRIRNYLERR